jgi:hypothetical protein
VLYLLAQWLLYQLLCYLLKKYYFLHIVKVHLKDLLNHNLNRPLQLEQLSIPLAVNHEQRLKLSQDHLRVKLLLQTVLLIAHLELEDHAAHTADVKKLGIVVNQVEHVLSGVGAHRVKVLGILAVSCEQFDLLAECDVCTRVLQLGHV